MNGQLALLAALAAHGGRWLRSGDPVSTLDLSHGNSSFQYVGAFSAQMPPRGLLRRSSTLVGPEKWLAALREGGVDDLELITDVPARGPLPPHLASAFSNAGRCALLATGATLSSAWAIDWQVRDRNGPASERWALTARVESDDGLSASEITVDDARDRLHSSLGDIRTFVETTADVGGWASWFAKSEALLVDPEPIAPYHRDLLPIDAELPRRQLAAAVVQGWVFGGMGSWNDGGSWSDGGLDLAATQREYERVSASLYASLLVGLAAAANRA